MNARLPRPIVDHRIIAVARGLDRNRAPAMAAALSEGGVTVIEVSVDRPASIDAIESIRSSALTVGAGSVTSIAQAYAAIEAGATFIVSTHADPDLIAWADTNSVVFVPGALTPTEVANTWATGVAAVRLFPASLGGPAYLRDLLSSYPDASLIPAGGIDDSNINEYLGAGAAAVGVGEWLTGPDNPTEITERAAALRATVTSLIGRGTE